MNEIEELKKGLYEQCVSWSRHVKSVGSKKEVWDLRNWKLLTSLAAFSLALKISREDFSHLDIDVVNILNKLSDPASNADEEVINEFYSNDTISSLWQKYIGSDFGLPTYNVYLYIDDKHEDPNWREDVTREYYNWVYANPNPMSIFNLLWIECIYDNKAILFRKGFFATAYSVLNLEADLRSCRNVRGISVQDSNIEQAVEDVRNKFTELLNEYDGYILSFLVHDDYDVEFAEEVAIAESELMRAARKGSAESVTPVSMEEAEYKELAIDYLKGVDYISEDEIDGIVDSTFINYSPKEAYEVIQKTY